MTERPQTLPVRPGRRRRTSLLVAGALAGALTVPAFAGPSSAASPAGGTSSDHGTGHGKGHGKGHGTKPGGFSPTDDFTANWTRAQALKIAPTPSNTKPLVPEDFPVMTEKVWIWDTWPLTDLDMKPVSYKGWKIIFSLTAPRDIFFGDRHWQARIGFFYSRDAKSWTYGGLLFPDGASFGSREWAGSTVWLGDGRVQTFYTASGRDNGGIDPSDALQRLATATSRIHADGKRVWFTGGTDHRIIAQADGTLYQTLEQSTAGPIVARR